MTNAVISTAVSEVQRSVSSPGSRRASMSAVSSTSSSDGAAVRAFNTLSCRSFAFVASPWGGQPAAAGLWPPAAAAMETARRRHRVSRSRFIVAPERVAEGPGGRCVKLTGHDVRGRVARALARPRSRRRGGTARDVALVLGLRRGAGAQGRVGLTAAAAAWLTLAVQLGFVAGTLVSALGNLPDVFATRRLFALSAWLGAAANAGLAVAARGPVSAVILRFLTGFFLAGVYPPGMKILATWFRRGRGLAFGVLVGGISLGKAFPYLVNAVGHSAWRVNVLAVSSFAVAGGALVLLFVGDGPY